MIRFDGWVTELADPVKMKEINDQQSNGRCGLGYLTVLLNAG